MKKFVILVALFIGAMFTLDAQTYSSLSEPARLAYDWLLDDGYKPSVDEDGDVQFKAQGYFFYVQDNDDDKYLRLVMPVIKSIDMDDIIQIYSALSACNEITKRKRLVKAYVNDEGDVSLAVSTYIDDSPEVGYYLDKSINFLISARESWLEEYESGVDALEE